MNMLGHLLRYILRRIERPIRERWYEYQWRRVMSQANCRLEEDRRLIRELDAIIEAGNVLLETE
jgi:hypothetical protein